MNPTKSKPKDRNANKQPKYAHCMGCSYEWIYMFSPLMLSQAATIMANLHCPNCAADATQIAERDVISGIKADLARPGTADA